MPKIKLPPLTIPNSKSIAIGVCCIALIAIFFATSDTSHRKEVPENEKPVFINPFASSSVHAESVFVYAPQSTHTMHQKNAHTPLPLASLTKVMTAYVTSLVFSDDDTIVIYPDDLLPEGDGGINPGEQWTFKDVRDIMLVASSNDAAEALRRATDERLALNGSASTTIGIMNEKARSLGWTTLEFRSVTGLDDAALQATAYGSARDIALAFTHIMTERPDIFEATREAYIVRGPLNGYQRAYNNTNVTVNEMPSILASKTGFTDAAGGNVIAAFDAGLGSPIVIAVLGSDNQHTRFSDLMDLSEKALRYINGTYYSGI